MDGKVKISKKVADTIEKTWAKNRNSKVVVKHLYLTNWSLLMDEEDNNTYEILRDFATEHPIDYMRALVEGYEVELTPEEVVKQLFYRSGHLTTLEPQLAYRLGMKDFAKAYGIQIDWHSV